MHEYRTLVGSFLSFCTVIFILFFAGYRMLALINYEDYKVQLRDKENFYNMTEPFGNK